MDGRENRCNGGCHEIYPSCNGHMKQRRNRAILGSAGQFCAAFYHVHEWGGRNHYCLETNCIIAENARETEDWRVQAKTVVAVVKFKDERGNSLYEARYTNCKTNKKHAEDFFEEDIGNENGDLRRLVVEEPNRKGSITLYLTYQPCNKSTLSRTTPPDKSCCDTLIRIYENILEPHDISLCVKAANTYRLEMRDEDADPPEEDEEVPSYEYRNTPETNGILQRNAVRGITRLKGRGVKLREMREDSWDYLFTMTNSSVPREYKLRDKLDDSVHNKLSI